MRRTIFALTLGISGLVFASEVNSTLVHTNIATRPDRFANFYRQMVEIERFIAYCDVDIRYFSDFGGENCRKSLDSINEVSRSLQMGELKPSDESALRSVISEILKHAEKMK